MWDEAIYADAARGVLDGHVLILQLSGNGHALGSGVFLEKPPLVPWLQAVSMGVLGEGAAAARLPSLLAFVGCVILVVYIAAEFFSETASIVAGLLLIFSNAAVGTHGPMYGSTDTVLTLFGSLAVWMWVQYQRSSTAESWRLYLAAGALAAATLTKGVAVAVFVLAASPAILWRMNTVFTQDFWKAAGLFVLLAAPWFLYAFAVAGDVFINQFWAEQVVRRSTGEFGVEAKGLFPWMRAPYFIRGPQYLGIGIVGLVSLGVGSEVLRTAVDKELQVPVEVLYLIFWGGLFPVFYAIAGGNHIWYILPSVVPLAVLGGWSLERLVENQFPTPNR